MKMKINWPFRRRKAAKRNPNEEQRERQELAYLMRDLRREKSECEKARLGLMDSLQEQYLLLENQGKMFEANQKVVDLMLDQLERANGISQEGTKKWAQ